jgi:hypothetical protein
VFIVNGRHISADSLLRLFSDDASQVKFHGWKRRAQQGNMDTGGTVDNPMQMEGRSSNANKPAVLCGGVGWG